MEASSVDRGFYEGEYHFGSDVGEPAEERMRRALDLLQPTNGAVFVDVGCGVGWGAHFARRDGARIAVGLDFAHRALALGNRQIDGVARLQADGCRLPLRDRSIDRLLSFGSLEHFPDPDAGLREIARVLQPQGVAVIVVPNFYVRTEQPRELRLRYGARRRRFTAAGLYVTDTAADPGPAVLRDRRPVRMAARAAAKVLAVVPRLPYQFIFRLELSENHSTSPG